MRSKPDRFPGGRLLRPGVWELRFSLGPDPLLRQSNGRPVYRRRSVTFKARTKTEARAEWARLNADERPKVAKRTDATFKQLFDRWLKAANLEASTVQGHEMLYQRHIGPAIGHVKLRDLGTERLEELYGALHRPKPDGAGLAASSIRRLHSVIDSTLKRGVAWEWIDRNPAQFAKPPKVHGRPDTYTPTIQELHQALRVAAEKSLAAFAFVWTAAATGMRRGELCGLRWADVDGQAQVIHVRLNVVDVGGEIVEKAPKTGKSRQVEIPAELVIILARYQMSLTIDLAPGDEPGPWLWTGARGNRARPDQLTALWNEVRAKAGIPKACRLHDLRHAYGSILTAAGGEGTVAAVAAQLGHGDMSTTMRHYLSAQTDDRRMAADLIGRLLAGTSEEG